LEGIETSTLSHGRIVVLVVAITITAVLSKKCWGGIGIEFYGVTFVEAQASVMRGAVKL
jgi:hypothetical protein